MMIILYIGLSMARKDKKTNHNVYKLLENI